MNEVQILRADEEQWREVRSIRLAALRDSPSAFGSTLEREVEYDERRWREWARSAALFLAVPDREASPVGMAAGIPGADDGTRQLVSMWVSPDWRGRGAASHLLDSVAQWARADDGCNLRLWVTQGNIPAQRLYERHGYTPTGRVKSLPSNPELAEQEMELRLTEDGSPSSSQG